MTRYLECLTCFTVGFRIVLWLFQISSSTEVIIFYLLFSILEEKYVVKTKIVAVNFSLGHKAVNIVKEQVGQLPINILGK